MFQSAFGWNRMTIALVIGHLRSPTGQD